MVAEHGDDNRTDNYSIPARTNHLSRVAAAVEAKQYQMWSGYPLTVQEHKLLGTPASPERGRRVLLQCSHGGRRLFMRV